MNQNKIALGATTKRLLIVEGNHEVDLCQSLLKSRSIDVSELQILPIGGKSNLQQNLRALAKDAQFPSVVAIGIVRDADQLNDEAQAGRTAAQLAMDAVCGCLRNVSLPVPTAHAAFGGTPSVGIFVMPDGKSDGMLENLCRDSVQTAPAAECVERLVACLSEKNLIKEFTPKAWTHAFISCQEQPDVHLGGAAKKGYWDFQHESFDPFVAFLQELLSVSKIEN